MTKYFTNFELITYNNSVGINVMQRVAIFNKLFSDRYSFYPYQVKNGMRAEQVAEKYYGSPEYVWLVYLSNNIIDPYYGWTMDESTFRKYIIEKYGSEEAARNKIISYRVNWYNDTSKLSQSQYNMLQEYEKKYWTPNFDNNNLPLSYSRKPMDYESVAKDEDGVVTSPIPAEEQAYWAPVTAFDVEEEANADKAHIRLLDNRLAQTAAANLRELLTD